MATFFGEILPVISRAVDDDEDEDDDVATTMPCLLRWTPEVHTEISKQTTKKLPCSTVVIAIDAPAVAFTQIYIRHHGYKRVGAMFSNMDDDDVNSLSQTAATDKSCHVYRQIHDPSVFVCECNVRVTPEQSFSWAQAFFSALDVSTAYVGVLASRSVTGYLSDISINDIPVPFMRALRTSPFQGTPFCPYLAQPNVISGLPAQIMTQAEMDEVRCVTYICYTDTLFVEHATIKAFLPILRRTPVRHIVTENLAAEESLRKLVSQHNIRDSLYL